MFTKHLFDVAFMKPMTRKTKKTILFMPIITKLIAGSFSRMSEDETSSVNICLEQGEAVMNFGFNTSAWNQQVIAIMLFSADINGIYINWLVVSNQCYNKVTYGKKATGEPF